VSRMKIIANGQQREMPNGATLKAFLESLALPPTRVAVERNGSIVPRERFDSTPLADGDRLEVVTLVGGG